MLQSANDPLSKEINGTKLQKQHLGNSQLSEKMNNMNMDDNDLEIANEFQNARPKSSRRDGFSVNTDCEDIDDNSMLKEDVIVNKKIACHVSGNTISFSTDQYDMPYNQEERIKNTYFVTHSKVDLMNRLVWKNTFQHFDFLPIFCVCINGQQIAVVQIQDHKLLERTGVTTPQCVEGLSNKRD